MCPSVDAAPPEVDWLLCVELYEASDLPFDSDVSVVISVGSQAAESKPPSNNEGTGGGRVMWYQTTYMNLKFPTDIKQVRHGHGEHIIT